MVANQNNYSITNKRTKWTGRVKNVFESGFHAKTIFSTDESEMRKKATYHSLNKGSFISLNQAKKEGIVDEI